MKQKAYVRVIYCSVILHNKILEITLFKSKVIVIEDRTQLIPGSILQIGKYGSYLKNNEDKCLNIRKQEETNSKL